VTISAAVALHKHLTPPPSGTAGTSFAPLWIRAQIAVIKPSVPVPRLDLQFEFLQTEIGEFGSELIDRPVIVPIQAAAIPPNVADNDPGIEDLLLPRMAERVMVAKLEGHRHPSVGSQVHFLA
jgi:hypothetical protein